MAALFSSIGANAFSSPVGQRIENATDSMQPTEDWRLILEVCDIINETDEGPKDALKAIRKRITNHKNYKSILYTLTLTEACVKNCGPRFHKQIASKDFLVDLTKILGQKGIPSNLPHVVKEKVLSLIQSWADAFRNVPELQQIQTCYQSLKDQGHEFPAQDLDTLSPIFTPNKSGSLGAHDTPQAATIQPNGARIRTYAPTNGAPTDGTPTNGAPATQVPGRVITHQRQQHQPKPGPINPSPEQLSKLRSELDIVEGNVRVLSEMLTEMQPGEENPDDYKLLVELNKTCREMQSRLVMLVDKIANEEVTGVLLRINDDLNNVFIRYDRYDKNHKAVMGDTQQEPQQQLTTTQPPIVAATTAGTESSLINFEPPSNKETDDFDMFAQSRSSTFADSRAFGSTYDDNTEGVPTEGSIAQVMSDRGPYPPLPEVHSSPGKKENKPLDDDLEDVEEWLKTTDLAQLEADEEAARAEARRAAHKIQTSEDAQSSMTSTEFDKFLTERATSGSTRLSETSSSNNPEHPPPPRQMKNFIAEKEHDEMFAL